MTPNQAALANAGIILFNPPVTLPPTRTFIISGVARGGTSLLAKLFIMADVPLGDTADPVVFEDREIATALERRGERTTLHNIIEQRNAEHQIWGFKRPNLFDHLAAEELSCFRQPSLVLIFRDPVAVAQRNVISNRSIAANSLDAAADGLAKLASFARRAACPTLLVSYEKALAFPGRLIDALAAFSGWILTDSRRARMINAVTVDNPIYWQVTRIEVKGFIDKIAGGLLCGWCYVVGSDEPVRLQLSLDGRVAAEFNADNYRDDLAKAGIGNGRHAFSVDLAGLEVSEKSVVTVQIKDRDFRLVNSGQTVAHLRQKRER